MEATRLAQGLILNRIIAERGGFNRVCTEVPQESEDLMEVTSKDLDSEGTEAHPNPLFLLISPPLKVICSTLLTKYPQIIGNSDKWTVPLRSFMLKRIGNVVS